MSVAGSTVVLTLAKPIAHDDDIGDGDIHKTGQRGD